MAAKPSTGTLGQTPLCQLLVFLLERKLNGSLVIQHLTGGKSSMTVREGVPVKLRAGNVTMGFGDVCVLLGLVERDALDAVLAGPLERALGEELVVRGLLSADKVPAVLEEQMYARLEWIAAEPVDTIFGFYPDQDFLSGWGGLDREIDPLRAIGRTLQKRGLSTAKVDQVLVAWSDRVVRLHPNARIGRFGFSKDVAAAFDVLRAKPMSIRELGQLGLGKSADLVQALGILALCRHLDVGEEPLGVTAASSSPPIASRETSRRRVATGARLGFAVNSERGHESEPPGRAPLPSESGAHSAPSEAESAELRSEVARQLDAVTSQDYYQILGVDEKADQRAIQAAFLTMARRWHPDRLPPALKELRTDVTRIFARMTEAHQVLTQPQQRAEYDRLRASGPTSEADQRAVEKVLRAATLFQKAEVLAKRGEWAQAEAVAKQAADMDPEQAEYSALYAWIIAKSGQRAAHGNYDDLLELLTRAANLQKKNARIRLYRAFVLKASGKLPEALRDYRAVVELDPGNVEASRELRLNRMRNEGTTTQPGVLSRWFKK
jgi:curved DNA-binding protein CbpA